jgi:hypothetical protein
MSIEEFKAKWGTKTASLTIKQMCNDIMLPERLNQQTRDNICSIANELAEDLRVMLMSYK